MFVRSFCLFVLLLFTMSSCASRSAPRPQKTQLQIRQMQTHVFDTQDYRLVMKAMLNVLQDEGYVVKNVDVSLGFLTATKELEERRPINWWFSEQPTWVNQVVIDVTANITEYEDKIRVRVNFQVKEIDNQGVVYSIRQVENPDFYQTFFSKVSKSIFIQEENL